MFLKGGRIDNYIIHIFQTYHAYMFSEDVILHSLECSGGIFEAKRQTDKFVMSSFDTERGFWGVFLYTSIWWNPDARSIVENYWHLPNYLRDTSIQWDRAASNTLLEFISLFTFQLI